MLTALLMLMSVCMAASGECLHRITGRPHLMSRRKPHLPDPWRNARLLLLAALLSPPLASSAEQEPVTASTSMSTIRDLIGDADCSNDSQCRTIAIGMKPCGGPEAYLAWSTQNTDPAKLQHAVSNYNSVRSKEISPSSDRMSDCALVGDPGAVCSTTSVTVPGSQARGIRGCRLRSIREGARAPIR
jgi:hypothetical protein